MSYKTELQSNNTDLQSLIDQANALPDYEDLDEELTTQDDLIAQITTTLATKSLIQEFTPEISVSELGLITAVAGSKSATKQLTTKGATTITPTTSNITAATTGNYITGNIVVKGDSNLVASNIKSGVSIFGVSGSVSVPTIATASFKSTSDGMSGTIYYTDMNTLTQTSQTFTTTYGKTFVSISVPTNTIAAIIWNDTSTHSPLYSSGTAIHASSGITIMPITSSSTIYF